MAEFKKVFEHVSKEILEAHMSVDDFLSWLGKKKSDGAYLENWTLEEIRAVTREYKEIVKQSASAANGDGSDFSDNESPRLQDSPLKRDANVSVAFVPTQPHTIQVVK